MIETGTIIRGTLLMNDLVPAFMDVLRAESPASVAAILDEYGPGFIERASTPYGLDYTTIADTIYSENLMEDLYDAMQAIAPEHHYFGTHEGDGSDFGYWLYDDAP